MAFSRNHALVMVTPDDPAYENKPSNWNAAFVLSGAVSGGIPYFSSATEEASSALLAANALVIGGGAGAAPFTGSGLTFGPTAGQGLAITAGTATTDVNALSTTQAWNNVLTTFVHEKHVITDTLSAAGSLALQYLGGTAGTTNLFSVNKSGGIRVPTGSRTAPAIVFGIPGINSAIYENNGALCFADDDVELVVIDLNYPGLKVRYNALLSWTAGENPSGAFPDTGFSRISAGVAGVGTGAAGSTAGQLQFASSKRIGSANNRSADNKILYGATTDAATAVSLTTDGAGAGAGNQISVPTDTTLSVVVNIAVKQSGSANAKQMLRQFLVSNNAGTTAIQGSVTTLGTDVTSAGLATVAVTITADDTNDVINIAVTGVIATNLRYSANVVSCETLYA